MAIFGKVLELRDEMTFIPWLAVRVEFPLIEAERYLLARSGFGRTMDAQQAYVRRVR